MSEPLWSIEHGDCLNVLRALPDGSFDALVTDPPAGIAFMGKAWDKDKGGRDAWVAWLQGVMVECLRVLKPGAHGLVWALPRTSGWTQRALEDAGFEIRDVVVHLFGSGFPKSLDVSKAIDAAAGAEREIVVARSGPIPGDHGGSGHCGHGIDRSITAPATPEAQQWSGWGTALKPSSEHWILVRKPLDGTVAANVLAHGVGGLNVDGCRVGSVPGSVSTVSLNGYGEANRTGQDVSQSGFNPNIGRWPPNTVLSHADGCECVGTKEVLSSNGVRGAGGQVYANGRGFANSLNTVGQKVGFASPDGTETVPAYACVPGCPVAELDAQSGGGASRFFPGFHYQAKPSTREKERGLEQLPKKSASELVNREEESAGIQNPRAGAGRISKGRANTHPTVKSIELMRWLCRLITPPQGIVLDPFCGSGSTGVACLREGFSFVGCEQSEEYVAIATARLEAEEK